MIAEWDFKIKKRWYGTGFVLLVILIVSAWPVFHVNNIKTGTLIIGQTVRT